MGALFVCGMAAASPAAAQFVTFGSPNDPSRIALGGGVFDVLPDNHKRYADREFMVGGEYRFGDVWWIFSPFVGLFGTAQGGFYGYFGFGFDIHFADHWILNPTGAFGYFVHGNGLDLGSREEFRTGAELDYRFDNLRRVGVAFYHISNAGIGQQNPGQEMLNVVFTVPLH
jgi:lipid A 3-O-deacylase